MWCLKTLVRAAKTLKIYLKQTVSENTNTDTSPVVAQWPSLCARAQADHPCSSRSRHGRLISLTSLTAFQWSLPFSKVPLLEKRYARPETQANIFICSLDHVYQAPFANMKIERRGWPEIPLILGRSGTQYVAMGIKLLSPNCRAHLAESYCKE